MKLLKKSTINVEIASERRKQIDEGMFVAKKVDLLRETLVNLEQQHAKFVDGMERQLVDRTKETAIKLKSLQDEITSLQEKRNLLLIPLDEEWKKVNIRELEIEKLKNDLIEQSSLFLKQQLDLDIQKKKEKTVLTRINTREKELIRVYSRAEENTQKSEEVLNIRLREKTEDDKFFEEKNKELIDREASIAVKERELKIHKDIVDEKIKENDIREMKLLDREQTLEREINRIKNNGELINI